MYDVRNALLKRRRGLRPCLAQEPKFDPQHLHTKLDNDGARLDPQSWWGGRRISGNLRPGQVPRRDPVSK